MKPSIEQTLAHHFFSVNNSAMSTRAKWGGAGNLGYRTVGDLEKVSIIYYIYQGVDLPPAYTLYIFEYLERFYNLFRFFLFI